MNDTTYVKCPKCGGMIPKGVKNMFDHQSDKHPRISWQEELIAAREKKGSALTVDDLAKLFHFK